RGTGGLRASGRAIDRPTRDHTPKIGQRRRLDPVTARLNRPRLEPESPEHRRVTVVTVVGVPDERIERRPVRLFNAPEEALALVNAEPREGAGGVVDSRE